LSQAHTPHQESPDDDAQAEGNQPHQQGLEHRIIVLPMVLHPLGFQVVEQTGILNAHGDKVLRWRIFAVCRRPQGALQGMRRDLDLRNPTLAQHGLEVTIR
jgi:hypothetical protein